LIAKKELLIESDSPAVRETAAKLCLACIQNMRDHFNDEVLKQPVYTNDRLYSKRELNLDLLPDVHGNVLRLIECEDSAKVCPEYFVLLYRLGNLKLHIASEIAKNVSENGANVHVSTSNFSNSDDLDSGKGKEKYSVEKDESSSANISLESAPGVNATDVMLQDSASKELFPVSEDVFIKVENVSIDALNRDVLVDTLITSKWLEEMALQRSELVTEMFICFCEDSPRRSAKIVHWLMKAIVSCSNSGDQSQQSTATLLRILEELFHAGIGFAVAIPQLISQVSLLLARSGSTSSSVSGIVTASAARPLDVRRRSAHHFVYSVTKMILTLASSSALFRNELLKHKEKWDILKLK